MRGRKKKKREEEKIRVEKKKRLQLLNRKSSLNFLQFFIKYENYEREDRLQKSEKNI